MQFDNITISTQLGEVYAEMPTIQFHHYFTELDLSYINSNFDIL